MNLHLHGSLGDHVIMTGIPEAYYREFGERTYVPNKRSNELWVNNPYLSEVPIGINHTVIANSLDDYKFYYPSRVYRDITGVLGDKNIIAPNLYIERETESDLCIVNDQAGWPTRRDYPFISNLIDDLKSMGWRILYLRNDGFRDCNGIISDRQIDNYDYILNNPTMMEMLNHIRRAGLYIGYDSGIYQLASALRIPSILISGAVPYENIESVTSVYVLSSCENKCKADRCDKLCLTKSRKYSDNILSVCEGVLKGITDYTKRSVEQI